MSELLKIVSSQYKHLLNRDDEYINSRIMTKSNMLCNESFSFQVLYRNQGEGFEPVSIRLETVLPAKAWRVDYVAVQRVTFEGSGNEYESKDPGLYPDVLTPRPVSPEIVVAKNRRLKNTYFEKGVSATLNAVPDAFQSVWFTLNPNCISLNTSEYKVKAVMISLNSNEIIAEEQFTLTVIDKMLPQQDFYYTNWFHVDCLCDMFGVKPYSNAFYKIFDKYIKNMTEHCQNTLLLPGFVPALDTAVGTERMNVQLVEIENVHGEWVFGFDKMRRFIRHAKKCGIKFFEHSHIFSQWGARNAPNIYDKSDKRIFGYDTIASSDEYIGFIRAYLKAFLAFAIEEKIEKNIILHISDEPEADQLENYRIVHNGISDLVKGIPVCDAMFDCSFYEKGLVDQPILHIESLKEYDDKKCPSIWLYYTGGEEAISGRKIPHTAATTRVIGLLMYKYKAKGFLQWAYNFYYDRFSFGFANPMVSPNAYKQMPGITSLCYPTYEHGEVSVNPSIREMLMGEAMDDYRALKLLETKIGRDATLTLCEEKIGEINAYTIPEGEELRELRELINAKIAE